MQLRTLINNRYIVLAGRIIVGAVFIGGGVLKLLHPTSEFIQIVQQWQILPDPLSIWYATLLPWVEIIFGIFLVTGLWQRVSASIIGLCLLSFLIAIVINMVRGRTLGECGCFGGAFDFGKTFPELLARDIVLFLLDLYVISSTQKWLSLDKYFQ